MAGQPDSLCLAARQCVSTAIERQVVKANVGEKSETVANLLDDFVRDSRTPAADFHGVKKLSGVADRQIGDFGQAPLANEYVARRCVQTRAMAVGAGLTI